VLRELVKETCTLEEALGQLDKIAPGAPLLALGQTVFWDEPMKAGVALQLARNGSNRKFIAGVHDTDFFAKAPYGQRKAGKFTTLPHNDTTTKGLWSAAGEFSALFGSETVVKKETLAHAGLKVEKLQHGRPGFLDEATEAWGWKGVVSLDEHPPITAEVGLRQVWPELNATFDWALQTTLECISGQAHEEAQSLADDLLTKICDAREKVGSGALSSFYRELLPTFYNFVAGREVNIETTVTTELLRFNTQTCGLPRFDLPRLFADPSKREQACAAYNKSGEGTGRYGLDRFGTGALPFDLFVPGYGRGTIRLGNRGAVIDTPKPLFLSFKKPLTSLEELAAAVEAKFGPDCALIGKAVTLVGMLSREFVFVFHEGASSYVSQTHRLHGMLKDLKPDLEFNPILRIRYSPWDALQASCSWLHLPEPLRRPFGAEEVCSPSFASRWRTVVEEQKQLLEDLGGLRKTADLLAFIDRSVGGSWSRVADEYAELQAQLASLEREVSEVRCQRRQLYPQIKRLKQERGEKERAKGEHFRALIFEKDPTPADLQERERLAAEVDRVIHEILEAEHKLKHLMAEQEALVKRQEVQQLHEKRRQLEMEAEFKRLRMIRHAVISSHGLEHAGLRPSAWWFPLVCSDGLWFRQTYETAECYLESLNP
jgi:hypothetical protein